LRGAETVAKPIEGTEAMIRVRRDRRDESARAEDLFARRGIIGRLRRADDATAVVDQPLRPAGLRGARHPGHRTAGISYSGEINTAIDVAGARR